ncbi:MAG TPA: alpha-amylase family protein [Thermoguttaceae bacterium]|nr:alpha-amylase family protein [Thermoguttaceae bacterium]
MCPKRVVFVWLCLVGPVCAEPLTLPLDERPQWLRQEGIVMAGSWEPLLFRVRRDGGSGYTPTAEQRAAYEREHSPEMVARLKGLGVNFVMMHCYKGGGLEAERESMADAVRFSKLCHEAGLRVGVYVYSGAFIWELFFQEVPQAEDWVVRDEQGNPRMYGGRAKYRYYWNRNHPDAQAYYRQIVRFAVEEIKTDLVHFDNYTVGPGYDRNSVDRFGRYLHSTFTPEELRQMGIAAQDTIRPPAAESPDLLRHAWSDFSCGSLAESYHGMSRYARSLRPDVLIECNPGGAGPWLRAPRDHGRLLRGGEAFWDEGRPPGYDSGKLQSRIRTYKVARCMDNTAFCYTTTPLEMAESMAFNRDCLGAVCWFEYDKIAKKPGIEEPMSPDLEPFIRFFHARRDLLSDPRGVADVAVLRSFPSQVFAGGQLAQLTSKVEETLIRDRVPFQIIHDHQLDRLTPYRALVLAGCVALSDEQIEKIKAYVASGGRVCVIGPVATHDRWMRPRKSPALEELPASRAVRVPESGDLLAAIRRACNDELSLSIEGPPGLCSELTEKSGRRIVHLVNYRSDEPARKVVARVRLPAGRRAKAVTLASPERERDTELPFEQASDVVTFTVPEVAVYEIAAVTME